MSYNFGNKPILFYGIEDLIEAGIKDIGIIVGPNKDQVISAVNSVKWDAKIKFIETVSKNTKIMPSKVIILIY